MPLGGAAPTVQGSPYGNPPKRRKNNGGQGTGLPIDSQGRIDLSNIAAQRLNFMDQYNTQLSDINRNYAVQKRRMEQNEPYVQRGILSDYAGRGMAHSSGYGQAIGREQQLYQQGLNDLEYQQTLGGQQLQDARAAMRRTAQGQRMAIRQASADRLAAQAGTLRLMKGKRSTNLTNEQIMRILGLGKYGKGKKGKH